MPPFDAFRCAGYNCPSQEVCAHTAPGQGVTFVGFYSRREAQADRCDCWTPRGAPLAGTLPAPAGADPVIAP